MFYPALLGSVCSARHRLKQIKPCFNTRAGCETALRSEDFAFSHINSMMQCYMDSEHANGSGHVHLFYL